jgi:hypothetical protein
MTARVWCTRTDMSVFGPAGAWLKSCGEVREFPTLDQAKMEADRLNARRVPNCYYVAVELSSES